MAKKKEIDYLQKIKGLLIKLPHIMQVRFAYYCARSVIENIKNKQDYDKVNVCLLVVHRYIKGEAVTQKELIDAANSANSAAYSAAYSAYSATSATSANSAAYSAAYSAYSAYSATSAATSAYSAAYSANSANSAAYSATSAALKGYYEYLVKDIANLTELERIIYNIEV